MNIELERLLELIYSKTDTNKLFKVSVKTIPLEKLATILLSNWNRPISNELAKTLFEYSNLNEDKVIRLHGDRILITDCVGPSHEYYFHTMKINTLFLM